jgi:flagellar basal body-associated protein FliL
MMRVDHETEDKTTKHSLWVGIWKQVISFIVGVIVAAFVVGSARQKVSDLAKWKEEIAPKIERMDSVGSLSFDHFHKQYEKDQHRIDERLKDLEKDVRDFARERKTSDVSTTN